MEPKRHSLLFSKSSTEIKDLVKDFGIVCLDVPMAILADIKELTTTDFNGENGESVYFPPTLSMKAYDWKVRMGAMADSTEGVVAVINAFTDYLSGKDNKGTKLKIASAYTKIGRQGCYLKQIAEPDFSADSSGNSIAEFDVTFRITDPLTLITIAK